MRDFMEQYVRKIAYLFHYRNGSKGESSGYIRLSVRNGKGSLTVRLHPYRKTASPLKACLLPDCGQAEELGLLYAEGEDIEKTYSYEGEALRKLWSLSGAFLLAEDGTYYGARFDGKDVTEQMLRGALALHVQSFVREFTKASSPATENGAFSGAAEEMRLPSAAHKEEESVGQEQEQAALRAAELPAVEELPMQKKLPVQEAFARATETEKARGSKGQKGMTNLQAGEVSEAADGEGQYEMALRQFPVYRPFEEASIPQSVRIEPKDLRGFPREARPLAENSFLLHGFYLYKHLLLAKRQEEEGASYLLMVPGIFHYRDIYLANLFGFSSFLPIKEESRRENKKQGEFGYWYLTLA